MLKDEHTGVNFINTFILHESDNSYCAFDDTTLSMNMRKTYVTSLGGT